MEELLLVRHILSILQNLYYKCEFDEIQNKCISDAELTTILRKTQALRGVPILIQK